MKKYILVVSALILVGILSCKKDNKDVTPEPEKLISKWIIGRDTFATENVGFWPDGDNYSIGFPGTNGIDSAFNIVISKANLPLATDSFAIYGPTPAPESLVYLSFNGVKGSYDVYDDSHTYLYTSVVNGRMKLTLPPTYFRLLVPNPQGGLSPESDSTVIQGVFYAP